MTLPPKDDKQAQWDQIPYELKQRKQWAVCGPEYDPTNPKRPYNPITGKPASTTDPSTWASYQEAVNSRATHIGFMLREADPYIAIDLDSYKSEVPQNHDHLLATTVTYAERSQSGKGSHIIGKGRIKSGCNNRRYAIEIYSQDRFIITTGDRINDHGIEDIQSVVDQLIPILQPSQSDQSQLPPSQPSDESDDTLFERIKKAENGPKFSALYEGNIRLGNGKDGDGWLRPNSHALDYPSQSEADAALVEILCFFTGDNDQVIRLFHKSALGKRQKAERQDYLLRTIIKARAFIEDNKTHAANLEGFKNNLDHTSNEQSSTAPKGENLADPEPLPDGLPPVAPFNYDFLPENFQPFVKDIAERMQCPIDYVAAAIMTAAGAMIGRRVAIKPKPKDDWVVTANIWAVIIGEPSSKKSPAISGALQPLQKIEKREVKKNKARQKKYKDEMAEYKIRKSVADRDFKKRLEENPQLSEKMGSPNEPSEPRIVRLIAMDTSYEAVGAIMADNPLGILVYRDEIMALWKSLDKEENAAARAFYLTAWNGTDGYTFDRIMRGHLHIEAMCLSLLGSIQPSRVKEQISYSLKGGAGDDGFIQRFSLMIWPDQPRTWRNVDRYPDYDAAVIVDGVFERLYDIKPLQDRIPFDARAKQPSLTFDEAAAALFIEWLTQLENRLRSGELHSIMASHLGKYTKLVPALALINHLVDGKQGNVGIDALRKAIAYAEYLETHANRVYSAVLNSEVNAAKSILRHIKKGDLQDGFTKRDLLKKGWAMLPDSKSVQEALDVLVDYGWLIPQEDKKRSGRPTIRYEIHPACFR